MKKVLFLFALAMMTLVLMTSCQKDSEPLSSEPDEVIVQDLAASEEDEYLFELGLNDGTEDDIKNGNFGGGFGKIQVPLDSVWRFGRHINRIGLRRLEIVRTAPDTIKVALARELQGRFVTVEKFEGDSVSGDTLVVYRKPLRHVVRRKAIYVRNPQANDRSGRRGWHLYSVSLGQGNSVPPHTIEINEVSVVSSSGDSLVFTDPLNTMLTLDEVPTFVTGEMVTVRVKLNNFTDNPVDPEGNGSTETLLLHYGVNRHHHARKFFEFAGIDPVTGEHIYEGTWTIGQEPFRVYHAVIDAIDNGTIYDSDPATYPYNSTTWNIPYVVLDSD